MWFLVIIISGTAYATRKVCHFGIRIILSWRQLRRNIYKISSLPSPYLLLKEGHKFVKLSLSPLHQEWQKLTTEATWNPNQPRDSTRGIYITKCWNLPLSNNSLLIYLPFHNLLPLKARSPFPLSCTFLQNYCSLLRCFISPNSNHPLSYSPLRTPVCKHNACTC